MATSTQPDRPGRRLPSASPIGSATYRRVMSRGQFLFRAPLAHQGSVSRARSPQRSSIVRRSLVALALAALFHSGLVTRVIAAASAAEDARGGFAAFEIIAERNIFNPERSARRAGTETTESRRPARVDSFSLLGTMIYEKGRFAFFDGTSSEYRKVLSTGQTIAGFTLQRITTDGVTLVNGGETIELKVKSRMRREDGGAWQRADGMADDRGSFTRRDEDRSSSEEKPDSGGAPTGGASPDAAPDDILKRLLEKRREELK